MVLYIEAKKKTKQEDIDSINRINVKDMPKELILAYSIQYKDIAEKIKEKLEEKGIKVKKFQQVLGCSKLKSSIPIILIGSGRFHVLNLALQNNVPIYIYDDSKITKIDDKEIDNLKTQKKANINFFLNSEKIGIIISTKTGQNKLKEAEKLREKLEKKYTDKKIGLFISDNINLNELENFNVDFWINSACPGLIYDFYINKGMNNKSQMINMKDLRGFL